VHHDVDASGHRQNHEPGSDVLTNGSVHNLR
jgi:hypothetical protein